MLILDHQALPFLKSCLLDDSVATEVEIIGATNRDALDVQMIMTELEALEESTIILESLSLDSEVARISMASDDVLKPLVKFVENDGYPKSWSRAITTDRESMQKTFDICRGAMITVLTSIAGETHNSDKLWGSTPDPSSWFATTMLRWISLFSADLKEGRETREELAICGTLCIGNLAREGVPLYGGIWRNTDQIKDSRAMKLVEGPFDILPHLIDLLGEKTSIKVKNGAVGLLKNLSHPQLNRRLLGDRGVIEALTASGIWLRTSDMAEIVQAFGIGVCKHLANGNGL
jgi:hypothetical protein